MRNLQLHFIFLFLILPPNNDASRVVGVNWWRALSGLNAERTMANAEDVRHLTAHFSFSRIDQRYYSILGNSLLAGDSNTC